MPTTALLWAVHHDFLRYMGRIEDGQVAVVDGAEQLPDGGFRFPAVDDDSAADSSVLSDVSTRFRGAVSCTGHHGMLAITIAAPALTRDERQTTVLEIDDPFEPGRRMPMAELRTSAQDPAQFTAVLTEEGADLFQGVYPTGMALAPVRLEQDASAGAPTVAQRSSSATSTRVTKHSIDQHSDSIPSTEDLS